MRMFLLLLALAGHGPLLAEDRPAASPTPPLAEGDDDPADEILVVGTRQRGAVDGDIQPEVQLSSRDIRSFGASTVGELLAELSTLTRSGRGSGPPVVLVNGRRVSGFAEVRNLPPEAIERVDILPEEVALKYGFRADQRVVNFVLRPRFRALTGQLELGGPTAGGRREVELDANLARIRGDQRLSIEGEYALATALSEAERGVSRSGDARFARQGNVLGPDGAEIDPALSALAGEPVTVAAVPAAALAGPPTLGDFAATANRPAADGPSADRTLLAATERVELGGTLTRPLRSAQASLNGRLTRTLTESRLGLAGAVLRLPAASPFSPFAGDTLLLRALAEPGALGQWRDDWTARLGLALNGQRRGWRWTLTGGWDHDAGVTVTERPADQAAAQARIDALDPGFNPYAALLDGPFRRDRARALSDRVEADGLVSGALLDTAAGPLSATLRAGSRIRRLASSSDRAGVATASRLGRDEVGTQASFDLPLASRRRGVRAGLGDLAVNLNLQAEHLSDFGWLGSLGYGLNWTPLQPLRLIASVTHEEAAPSIGQLGNPAVATPNVRVFDDVLGETVEVTRLDGGNPALAAEQRRLIRLGVTWRPLEETELALSATYNDNRTRGSIAAFPVPTSAIEAAFPERFVRDGSGRLVQYDNRPVNFARTARRELRWGFNLVEVLEPTARQRAAIQKRIEEARARRAAAGGSAVPASPARTGADPLAAPPVRPGPPPGGGGGGRPGGGPPGGFGGGRPGEGRLTLSAFHNWRLADRILIRDGLPELDLLDGAATGSRGGQPRHQLELRATIAKNGIGARLQGDWQSATRVLADRDNPGPGDLFFADLATVNLRLFADLGQLRGAGLRHPLLRGARLSVDVDNLFDRRLRVTDRTGATPSGYQPDLLDPRGRAITLRVRKLLF